MQYLLIAGYLSIRINNNLITYIKKKILYESFYEFNLALNYRGFDVASNFAHFYKKVLTTIFSFKFLFIFHVWKVQTFDDDSTENLISIFAFVTEKLLLLP